jgi:lysophospholipase L1-like esterase
VGKQAQGAALVDGSNKRVTFGKSTTIVVPKGASVVSDPVTMSVPANAKLAVSVYLTGSSYQATGHRVARQTTYVSAKGAGNLARQSRAAGFAVGTPSWYWLDGVIVTAPDYVSTVVCLGDSITDGTRSTQDANHRYPDYLAGRIQQLSATRQRGVANAGISSNQLTKNTTGVSGLARLDRDVFAQPGVETLLFQQGINDIRTGTVTDLKPLAAAYRQVIDRAHARGIKVIGGTLLAFENDQFYTPEREALRQRVNYWIRYSGAFDAVVDFDKATRDPSRPTRLLPAYDSGDHIHPNDAGYRAMAYAIDLNQLN